MAQDARTLSRGVWETIDRVEATSLSKDNFLRRYARPGVPVIITGLVSAHFLKSTLNGLGFRV